MPLIDMPLSQLKEYGGRTPKPVDFDEFWDNGLAELAATDPAPELIPAEFLTPFADCFHLYFTGVGGARIYAKYLRPKRTGTPAPAVLQFHGYSGNGGDWNDKLGYVATGYAVASMDCRGQGGKSEDKGGVTGNTLRGHIIRGLNDALNGHAEKFYYRQVYLDTAQLARVVMNFDEVDASRVGATGGSQGGGLTLACAALTPTLKKAAAVFPFLCDYQRVWEMDLAKGAYEELNAYFRLFDPRHEQESDVFQALGYIDNQHLASRIQATTRMYVGLMDTICPPSTQFAAYNKITAPKDLVIYPDFGHEGLPGSGDSIYTFLSDL